MAAESTPHRIPRWLPNAISVLRLLLVPVFVLVAWQCVTGPPCEGVASPRGAAIGVLAFLGLSDIVDGTLARRYGLATRLGAVLDAVADKLAQISVFTFFALIPPGHYSAVPVWFPVLLFSRDALLGGGALMVRKRGVTFQHRWHGKAISVLLFLLACGVTLDAVPEGPWVELVAGAVVASALAYVVGGIRAGRSADA